MAVFRSGLFVSPFEATLKGVYLSNKMAFFYGGAANVEDFRNTIPLYSEPGNE